MKVNKNAIKRVRIICSTFICLLICVAVLLLWQQKLDLIRFLIFLGSSLLLWKGVSDLTLYNLIAQHGENGTAKMQSCDTPIFWGGKVNVLGFKRPIVEYYLEAKKHTVALFGSFWNLPDSKGNEVRVIYWAEYPEHIIFADPMYKKQFTIYIVILCTIFFMLMGAVIISIL